MLLTGGLHREGTQPPPAHPHRPTCCHLKFARPVQEPVQPLRSREGEQAAAVAPPTVGQGTVTRSNSLSAVQKLRAPLPSPVCSGGHWPCPCSQASPLPAPHSPPHPVRPCLLHGPPAVRGGPWDDGSWCSSSSGQHALHTKSCAFPQIFQDSDFHGEGGRLRESEGTGYLS